MTKKNKKHGALVLYDQKDTDVKGPLSKVFVYGTLKKGYGNNEFFLNNDRTKFIGDGITAAADFDMISLGGFPGVLDNGTCAILGEIYEVDDTIVKRLDSLESNGSMYLRKQFTFYTMDGEKHEDVWMYIFLHTGFGRDLNGDGSKENVEVYTIGDDDGDGKVGVHSWKRDTWDPWKHSTLATSQTRAAAYESDSSEEFEITEETSVFNSDELSDAEYSNYINDLLGKNRD
jgi:gamma-glutamylcyclotransferase (GGCT)/AIG2-like uncharacterized protein YtfP